MAPGGATSPTGMLWAYQLKREHGFLLDRMKRLESEITKVESTAKSAKNAFLSQDVAAIASQVQVLTQDGGSKATEKMRKEVMERLENVEAEMVAITSKVAELDQNSAKDEQERKRVFNNEKDLLKRIKEVERHLMEYEQNLNRIGDQLNEHQMDVIRDQLVNLLDQVKEDGGDRESFRESLQVLEEVTRELKQDNDKLAREIKALGKRPVIPTMSMPPPPMPAPSSASTPKALPMTEIKQSVVTKRMPPPVETQRNGKRLSGTACSTCRKTHKRCIHLDNGTDTDEEDEEEESVSRAPPPKYAPVPAAKTKPKQAQKKLAQTARAIKQEALDTQASRFKAPAARGLQREIQELKAASQFIIKESVSQLAAQKPAIASGRGWVNVERTPSDNKNAMAEQTSQDSGMGLTAAERLKRGRGRPKKILQDRPPPVSAPTRARGRLTKNASQLSTQVTQAETPKRGPGRPRTRRGVTQSAKNLVETPRHSRGRPKKDAPLVAKNVVNTPKHARGRPRKDGLQTPATTEAAAGLQIKQEYVESRLQPLREVQAAQTTEVLTSGAKAAPTKKEPGTGKKQLALGALKNNTAAPPVVERSEFSASPLSSGPPTPPKRKAAEQPTQQPQLKRRTVVEDDDSDY